MTTTSGDDLGLPTDQPAAHALFMMAGFASLGAGAIHAAAIGVHNDHPAAVFTFTVLATVQIAWGVAAVARRPPGRVLILVGALINIGALGGWILAKTTGIGFISGLETAERVQFADGSAAALALITSAFACLSVVVPGIRAKSLNREFIAIAAIPIVAITFASMLAAGSHSHSGSGGGDHHGGEETATPKAFDPDKGVDLSGVAGVSKREQAEAEELVNATIERLPQFSDISSLDSKGFYSIGDANTGYEHYVNWSYVNDDRILDPDYPESLVIRWDESGQTLVAAMFILPDGTTLDEVPKIGGKLIQWHVHADLCFDDDPIAPRLASGSLIVGVDQDCTPPSVKRGNVPMVHIWIVAHPCGPFAALEGVAGGQVREGEAVNCNPQHAHVSEERSPSTTQFSIESEPISPPEEMLPGDTVPSVYDPDLSPEVKELIGCVGTGGGDVFETLMATRGVTPSPETQALIEQCGGIPG